MVKVYQLDKSGGVRGVLLHHGEYHSSIYAAIDRAFDHLEKM
jgi:ribosome-associated translation inhibitor RaiA